MTSQLIATPVGTLAAIWTASGQLRSCGFTDGNGGQDREPLSAQQELLCLRITDYFHTGEIDWDMERLDWSGVSDFHQRVLRACYQIPAGQTLSYGALASRVGSPGAARAVGGAMARNRWPILIPCHRVLASSGHLTGYSGTGGVETKRWLLALEAERINAGSRYGALLS